MAIASFISLLNTKVNNMDYYKATVVIPQRSTISVMEWIRDHNCPVLKDTFFKDEMGSEFLIVSSFNPDAAQAYELTEDKPFEWKGMKRWTKYIFSSDEPHWVMQIDHKWYFASQV